MMYRLATKRSEKANSINYTRAWNAAKRVENASADSYTVCERKVVPLSTNDVNKQYY